jgi:CDP-diacylglycerol--serine O-phosphatidyltransferase
VMLVTEPWLTLSVVGLAYLASLPFTWLAARRMQQADAAAVPPAADEVAAGAAAERPTLPAAQSQERIVGFGRRGGAS